PFPAEVLHELAGELHRIPFDAFDARYARHLDAGQQLVQAVPELVEDGDDLVVRERRGLAIDRRGEIAGDVGDGMLRTAFEPAPIDGVVHPRATLLAGARVVVEIELPDERIV